MADIGCILEMSGIWLEQFDNPCLNIIVSKDIMNDLVLKSHILKHEMNKIPKASKPPGKAMLKEALESAVKDDLEILILSMLDRKGLCGYDIIKTIHKRFHVKISPGTLYPLLHYLNAEGIIEQSKSANRKVYVPTEKGKKMIHDRIQTYLATKDYLSSFITGK